MRPLIVMLLAWRKTVMIQKIGDNGLWVRWVKLRRGYKRERVSSNSSSCGKMYLVLHCQKKRLLMVAM